MATPKRPPKASRRTARTSARGTVRQKSPRKRSAAAKAKGTPRAEVGPREKPPTRPAQRPAFFADARHATDTLAEELGESFVLSATAGEDSEEYYERERPEEEGGPFLETRAHTEFAYGVDESNPEDAEPAPWPAVSPGQPPPHRPGEPR